MRDNRYLKLNIGIILVMFFVISNQNTSFSASPTPTPVLETQFRLLENHKDNTFKAEILVKNKSEISFKNWQLHFNFVRPVLAVYGAQLIEDEFRNGDYYVVKPLSSSHILRTNDQFSFEIKGKWFIRHYSDGPAGFFLSYQIPNSDKRHYVAIQDSETILPSDLIKDQLNLADRRMQEIKASTQINEESSPRISIVPRPQKIELRPGSGFKVRPDTSIHRDPASKAATDASIKLFTKALNLASHFNLTIEDSVKHPHSNTISYTLDQKLQKEAYRIEVNRNHIVVAAKTSAGFHNATQTLMQLLPAPIFKNSFSPGTKWIVPAVAISDHPRYEYRGLHLDVARHFLNKEEVMRVIDLMAMHKLNKLHWHLTDDEGWRIEIKSFPQLTDIGAWRGYQLPLAPTLGSGPEPYGGYYTQKDIKDIVTYASERNIDIIPEIDIPGHARAMIKALDHLLVDKDDHSNYQSVQSYNDNVLSACKEETYQVLNKIFAEVSQLFPGQLIHVGADEVPDGVWDIKESKHCRSLAEKEHLDSKQKFQNYFLRRVKDILASHNKTMAGWEELIDGGGFASKDVVAYIWQDIKNAKKVIDQGYKVVLTPASHLYFDLAYSPDPKEIGYYWAGYVDTKKAYDFNPDAISQKKSDATNDAIIGIQSAFWSETLRSRKDFDYKAFPRLTAMAEVAWTNPNLKDWHNFATRLNSHLSRLDQFGVIYRQPEWLPMKTKPSSKKTAH